MTAPSQSEPAAAPLAEDTFDFLIPAPLPAAPERLVAVGKHAPSSVDAEDFSRRLGNWGAASHLIGDRWEALAPELLRRRLPWTLPAGGGRTMTIMAVLALDADPAAGTVLQRAGVSAADLLLVGRLGRAGAREGLLLRAADCKVSLDTADPAQTAPVRLQATFQRMASDFPQVAYALTEQAAALPPEAHEAAARALAAALAGDWRTVLAGEGLFVAPDTGFNRWFLAQLEARRRTGVPLGRLPASGPRRSHGDTTGPVGPAQLARLTLPAHLEPTTAADFLGPLPGWPSTTVVAQLDGVSLDDADLSVAERCWRVGVGLRGAAIALRRPLFRPPLDATHPTGAPRDVSHLLRQVIERRKPDDSAGLVATFTHLIAQRRPLWEREAVVLQPPLPFGAFVTTLAEIRRAVTEDAQGGVQGDGSAAAAPSRASSRVLYKELGRRHRRRVLAEAAALAEQGLGELALLEALEQRLPEWRAACESDVGDLAEEELASEVGDATNA